LAKSLKYERAKEQVKKIKDFYGNLVSYCVVIPFLVFINYKTTGFDLPWGKKKNKKVYERIKKIKL